MGKKKKYRPYHKVYYKTVKTVGKIYHTGKLFTGGNKIYHLFKIFK